MTRNTHPQPRDVRHLPRGYAELQVYCGLDRERRLCNNTTVRRTTNLVVVRLHGTDIVTFYSNGMVKLDSGGYRTVTTKARINAVLPPGFHLYQKDHEWYLVRRCQPAIEFHDGMVFSTDLGDLDLPAIPGGAL